LQGVPAVRFGNTPSTHGPRQAIVVAQLPCNGSR